MTARPWIGATVCGAISIGLAWSAAVTDGAAGPMLVALAALVPLGWALRVPVPAAHARVGVPASNTSPRMARTIALHGSGSADHLAMAPRRLEHVAAAGAS